MSSDLLEDIDDDVVGVSILFEMYANGTGRLSLMNDDNILSYRLQPTQKDVDKALEISFAFLNWAEHVKETFINKEEGKKV